MKKNENGKENEMGEKKINIGWKKKEKKRAQGGNENEERKWGGKKAWGKKYVRERRWMEEKNEINSKAWKERIQRRKMRWMGEKKWGCKNEKKNKNNDLNESIKRNTIPTHSRRYYCQVSADPNEDRIGE